MHDKQLRMFVSAHKPLEWDVPDGYEVVQAGAALHPRFTELTDNTGDNISVRNPSYCELTVLYWAWKNTTSPRIGMVQYRRYFFHKPWQCSPKDIISVNEINHILDTNDILVGQPLTYHESVCTTYARVHHAEDMKLMKRYLVEHTPEYLDAFDQAMNARSTIYCNMLAAKREVLDSYMNWVMPMLEYAYNNIDTRQYDAYNKRLVGFIAERLFNVWLIKHANDYHIAYRPYAMLHTAPWDICKNELLNGAMIIWRALRG